MGNAMAGTVNNLNYNINYSSVYTRSTYNKMMGGDGYSTFDADKHGDLKKYYRKKSKYAQDQLQECHVKINLLK